MRSRSAHCDYIRSILLLRWRGCSGSRTPIKTNFLLITKRVTFIQASLIWSFQRFGLIKALLYG